MKWDVRQINNVIDSAGKCRDDNAAPNTDMLVGGGAGWGGGFHVGNRGIVTELKSRSSWRQSMSRRYEDRNRQANSPTCLCCSSDVQKFGDAQGKRVYFGCMPGANSLNSIHARVQILDLDTYLGTNSLIWMHVWDQFLFLYLPVTIFLIVIHSWEQFLDLNTGQGPVPWLGYIMWTNSLIWIHASDQFLDFDTCLGPISWFWYMPATNSFISIRTWANSLISKGKKNETPHPTESRWHNRLL